MRATVSDCIMSHGEAQRCKEAYKAQGMQVKALLLLSLLALAAAQTTPEPEPESTSSESKNGLVSYILTYSQDMTCEALNTKCKDLNCTTVICGIVKQLVVMQDPTGVSALSIDPALTTANQNTQVSLDYVERDVITAANASLETYPPWHLDRINQASLPLDGYYASLYTGVGVHIYMIDTGIQTNHSEFLNADSTGSRVVAGGWAYDGTNNTEDCNGHGTATASLAAGRTVGTSPNATLHAIRACACDGTAQVADIIGALNHVALNAIRPAVISMSVGTPAISLPLQLAVNNTVALYNLSIIAAAGNDASDACEATPGRSVYVGSIGATVIDDSIAEYSNIGKCTNCFAPGSGIYCANLNSGYQKISGTSMACPIVSGVIAQYLQYNSSLTTYDITDTLYRSRTRGNNFDSVYQRPVPMIQIPTQIDLVLLNQTFVSMYGTYL